jgi:hypothetical protein
MAALAQTRHWPKLHTASEAGCNCALRALSLSVDKSVWFREFPQFRRVPNNNIAPGALHTVFLPAAPGSATSFRRHPQARGKRALVEGQFDVALMAVLN